MRQFKEIKKEIEEFAALFQKTHKSSVNIDISLDDAGFVHINVFEEINPSHHFHPRYKNNEIKIPINDMLGLNNEQIRLLLEPLIAPDEESPNYGPRMK